MNDLDNKISCKIIVDIEEYFAKCYGCMGGMSQFTRRHPCSDSGGSRQASSWSACSCLSWPKLRVHALPASLPSPDARHLICRQYVYVNRLFHFLSPCSASQDSLTEAAFLLCSILLARPYACHRRRSSRRGSDTPESSF